MQRSNPSAAPRRSRRRRRGEEGQALVEFSLVLPILCLLLFGIIQFGLLFYNYIDLTSATRDAARQVSVARSSGLEEERVKLIVDDATTVVDDAKTTVVTTKGPWSAKQDVAVTVSYRYSLNIMGLVIWNGPMVAKSIARVE